MGVFFTEIMSEKNRVSIFWIENKHYKKKKIDVLKRAKKWTLFKGVSPWIWSKNRSFSFRPFLQKSYQKRSFFFILWKEKNDVKWKNMKF